MLQEISFSSTTPGLTLRGWLRLPASSPEEQATANPVPGVVIVGGYGDSAERSAPAAEELSRAGFGVLYYDHRNTGVSDGLPRLEIDGPLQQRDLRMAVGYACSRPELDTERIGVFGTSFGGSLAIAAGATDPQVKAVAASNPWISGFEVALRAGGAAAVAGFQQLGVQDAVQVLAGGTTQLVALGRRSQDPNPEFALFRDDAAMDYYEHGPVGIPKSWRNEMTLSSLFLALDHDISAMAARVSPTPLLMVVADQDTTMPLQPSLDFYNRALEPKKLTIVPGGHYDSYLPGRSFPQVMESVTSWMRARL